MEQGINLNQIYDVAVKTLNFQNLELMERNFKTADHRFRHPEGNPDILYYIHIIGSRNI